MVVVDKEIEKWKRGPTAPHYDLRKLPFGKSIMMAYGYVLKHIRESFSHKNKESFSLLANAHKQTVI